MTLTLPVIEPNRLSAERIAELQDEIRRLARERDAVVIAHNYQRPEVQDVAHFVGDSLGLSREAAKTDAAVIVFCGVHFMAETAAILSPQKRVLLPDLAAGCSLAATITAADVRKWKARFPGYIAVGYVNTTAEVKAELDYCCTSGNVLDVIDAIPESEGILFLPDFFLGAHVRRMRPAPERRGVAGRVPRTCRHPAGPARGGARGASGCGGAGASRVRLCRPAHPCYGRG